MNQPMSSPPGDWGERAKELQAGLALDGSALSAALLAIGEQWPMAIKDVASGKCVWANAAFTEMVAPPGEHVLGLTDIELFGAEMAAALRGAEQAALGSRGASVADQRYERSGRPRREFAITRVVLPSADGEPRHLLALWQDVTEVRQREAQLATALKQIEQQHQAIEALRRETQDGSLRDSVTGLYQRQHFDDQLRREVDLSLREHREFALVLIELDPLDEAARALGERSLTRVLEALGRLLRSNTRAMDASCRIDGDQFAVLLSGVGLATAHSRMEGFRRQCATQIVVLEGRDLGFTVSMGVASFPHTAHSQEELLQAARNALLEARRRGGNCVTLASIRFEPS